MANSTDFDDTLFLTSSHGKTDANRPHLNPIRCTRIIYRSGGTAEAYAKEASAGRLILDLNGIKVVVIFLGT